MVRLYWFDKLAVDSVISGTFGISRARNILVGTETPVLSPGNTFPMSPPVLNGVDAELLTFVICFSLITELLEEKSLSILSPSTATAADEIDFVRDVSGRNLSTQLAREFVDSIFFPWMISVVVVEVDERQLTEKCLPPLEDPFSVSSSESEKSSLSPSLYETLSTDVCEIFNNKKCCDQIILAFP